MPTSRKDMDAIERNLPAAPPHIRLPAELQR